MNLQYILFVGDIVNCNDNSVMALRHYVSKNIVECSIFEDQYLEFNSEEDFFKFKLMFDLDELYANINDAREEMHKVAINRMIEHANNLNW